MSDKRDIYLDDTVETFIFEKEALEIKLRHNIAELSNKNAYLSTILKELCIKEKEIIGEDCETVRTVIKVCRNMEDDLASLDILEKKTEILKDQVLAIAAQFKGLAHKESIESDPAQAEEKVNVEVENPN